MKTLLASVASVLVSVFVASADTIALWNFNSSPADGATTTGSTNTAAGDGVFTAIGGMSASVAPGWTSDPANSGGDNTAVHLAPMPPQGTTNKSAGARFAVNTSGYQHIRISWAQRVSNSGSRYWRFQYSSDGATFIDGPVLVSTNAGSTAGFTNFTVDLSSVAAVTNNPLFTFQIVAEWESSATGSGRTNYLPASSTVSYGTSGTLRFDMVTVTGDAMGAVNIAPTIVPPTNVVMRANSTSPPLPVVIGDAETAASALNVFATSSDSALLPPSGLVWSGAGSNRFLALTPTLNETGLVSVVVSVVDGGNRTNRAAFSVTVLPTNTPPNVSLLSNVSVAVGETIPPLALGVGDMETPAAALAVAAHSANPTLLPDSGITVSGAGSNRIVTLTPVAGQSGHALVAFTVSDGNLTASTSLLVTVDPSPGTIFFDPFTYSDGALVTSSGGLWRNHAGVEGELQVTGGRVLVSSDNTEDVNAVLRGAPYAPASGTNLYYSADIAVHDLPNPPGDYFLHLKDNTSTGFRARLMISTANAALGKYRFALGNAAGSPTNSGCVEIPIDLSFDETNRVVVRYNVATAQSTLWLNPTAETSASATATDAVGSTNSITQIALRESAAIGNIYVDTLRVALSFDEALGRTTVPVSLRIRRVGVQVQLSWPLAADGYRLYSRPAVANGAWTGMTNVTAAATENVVTVSNMTGAAFFRLVK